MTKVYFDVCCLNRPFDDQTQDRIRLEAEAVIAIMGHIEAGDYHWLSSEVVDKEIQQNPNAERRLRVERLLRFVGSSIRAQTGLKHWESVLWMHCTSPAPRAARRPCSSPRMTNCCGKPHATRESSGFGLSTPASGREMR